MTVSAAEFYGIVRERRCVILRISMPLGIWESLQNSCHVTQPYNIRLRTPCIYVNSPSILFWNYEFFVLYGEKRFKYMSKSLLKQLVFPSSSYTTDIN